MRRQWSLCLVYLLQVIDLSGMLARHILNTPEESTHNKQQEGLFEQTSPGPGRLTISKVKIKPITLFHLKEKMPRISSPLVPTRVFKDLKFPQSNHDMSINIRSVDKANQDAGHIPKESLDKGTQDAGHIPKESLDKRTKDEGHIPKDSLDKVKKTQDANHTPKESLDKVKKTQYANHTPKESLDKVKKTQDANHTPKESLDKGTQDAGHIPKDSIDKVKKTQYANHTPKESLDKVKKTQYANHTPKESLDKVIQYANHTTKESLDKGTQDADHIPNALHDKETQNLGHIHKESLDKGIQDADHNCNDSLDKETQDFCQICNDSLGKGIQGAGHDLNDSLDKETQDVGHIHNSLDKATTDIDPIHNSLDKTTDDNLEALESALHNIEEMEECSGCICKHPMPFVHRVRDPYNPNRVYQPQCVVLHRCTKYTGCCAQDNYECAPKTTHIIRKTFLVIDLHIALIATTLTFVNHTECECREKFKPVKCTKACPQPFRLTQDGIACRCDCFLDAFRDSSPCESVKDGIVPLSHDGQECIKNNSCYHPECTVGHFDIESWLCPLSDQYALPGYLFGNPDERRIYREHLGSNDIPDFHIKKNISGNAVTNHTTS